MNTSLLQLAARDARGLAIDAVSSAKSGHLGLPLGAAEIGAFLFGYALKINPSNPRWMNRDRFILSAGHGSMFLYAWLHLSGFDLPLEEIKRFRQLKSMTPGHPEFSETPGVEATTGPLGQGIANAVGMAISQKMAMSRLNTSDRIILDNRVVCLSGDGCLQEGIAAESSSLAGHLGLNNLICFFDSNNVTLDAPLKTSQSENIIQRYQAYQWDVQEVDGHDFNQLKSAYEKARNATDKPQMIVCHTIIGKGIAEVEGSHKAHGEAGIKYAKVARQKLGLPEEEFFISSEVSNYFLNLKLERSAIAHSWEENYKLWAEENSILAGQFENRHKVSISWDNFPSFHAGDKIATRKSASIVLQFLAQQFNWLISASADLFGSTLNYIEGGGDFTKENRMGRNLHVGIREHAMAGIMNGIAYDGLFKIIGATFLVFSDYARPSIRLAALARLPVIYFFTHDSVAVGEDGPTHEPVETITSLRNIPGLDVMRPADAEETLSTVSYAIEKSDGPTALILCRQNLPYLSNISINVRRSSVQYGAYIAQLEKDPLKIILLASGSELNVALDAASQLGGGVRVVSMLSMEIFLRQSTAYQQSILPNGCKKRISIEAGIDDSWFRFIGLDGKTVAINRFGMSAPGASVLQELGINVENILQKAQELMKE